jgi:hypothetical protein
MKMTMGSVRMNSSSALPRAARLAILVGRFNA